VKGGGILEGNGKEGQIESRVRPRNTCFGPRERKFTGPNRRLICGEGSLRGSIVSNRTYSEEARSSEKRSLFVTKNKPEYRNFQRRARERIH